MKRGILRSQTTSKQTSKPFVATLVTILAVALLSGCLSPRVHYQGHGIVSGEDLPNEASISPEVVVDQDSNYVVIRFDTFPQDMNTEVVHLGEFYRLTSTDGTVSIHSMEDIYLNGSLGYEPGEPLSDFEKRLRSREDVNTLERIGYNRTYSTVLVEGDRALILELDERGAAGAYRGIVWKQSLKEVPYDNFEFTISPEEAASSSSPDLDNR